MPANMPIGRLGDCRINSFTTTPHERVYCRPSNCIPRYLVPKARLVASGTERRRLDPEGHVSADPAHGHGAVLVRGSVLLKPRPVALLCLVDIKVGLGTPARLGLGRCSRAADGHQPNRRRIESAGAATVCAGCRGFWNAAVREELAEGREGPGDEANGSFDVGPEGNVGDVNCERDGSAVELQSLTRGI